jgi:cell division protein FtsB
MPDKSPEEQATQMFVDMLPHVLSPVIAKRQAEIANLNRELDQLKGERDIIRQEIAALRVEEEGLTNSIAQEGRDYLDLKERRRRFVLGDDA